MPKRPATAGRPTAQKQQKEQKKHKMKGTREWWQEPSL